MTAIDFRPNYIIRLRRLLTGILQCGNGYVRKNLDKFIEIDSRAKSLNKFNFIINFYYNFTKFEIIKYIDYLLQSKRSDVEKKRIFLCKEL